MKPAPTVQVAVRARPLLENELEEGARSCLEFVPGTSQVIVAGEKSFSFDYTLDPDSTQADVYNTCITDLVQLFLTGYNCSVLAYGQTGSGKTYTVGTDCNTTDELSVGIVPRILSDVFTQMQSSEDGKSFLGMSLVEIYNEDVYDLLNAKQVRKPVSIREQENVVKMHGLEVIDIYSKEEAVKQLEYGCKTRTTAATAMNAHSSRSHAIFTLYLKHQSMDNTEHQSKFHVVDLAGSETVRKTQAVGDRFREGISINAGLLALGNVIRSLCEDKGQGKKHIPYRNSVLTRLLKDSIGGNSHTIMIACVGPAHFNQVETTDTLGYAERTQKIKARPTIVTPIKQPPGRRQGTPVSWRPQSWSTLSPFAPVHHNYLPQLGRPSFLHSTICNPSIPSNSHKRKLEGARHLRDIPPPPLFSENLSSTESVPILADRESKLAFPDVSIISSEHHRRESLASLLSPLTQRLRNCIKESFDQKMESFENRVTKKLHQTLQDEIVATSYTPAENAFLRTVHQAAKQLKTEYQASTLCDVTNRMEPETDASPILPTSRRCSVVPDRLEEPDTTSLGESICNLTNDGIVLSRQTTDVALHPKQSSPKKYFLRPRKSFLSSKENCGFFIPQSRAATMRRRTVVQSVPGNPGLNAAKSKSRRSMAGTAGINPNLRRIHYETILKLLNVGSSKEIQNLPTIGLKTAQMIVTWRTLNGPFKAVRELKHTPGLTESLYRRFLVSNILDDV